MKVFHDINDAELVLVDLLTDFRSLNINEYVSYI